MIVYCIIHMLRICRVSFFSFSKYVQSEKEYTFFPKKKFALSGLTLKANPSV